jgi:hypothetical protein
MDVQVNRLGLQKKYKHKSWPDDTRGPSLMGRCYSYDILANPEYSQRFAYIPTSEKGRLSYIASPDHDE